MTTPTTVNVQIQLRADTAANWTAENPTLLANEFALETDTKKLKVGDGTTAWASLAYFPSIVSGGTVLGNLEIGTTGTLTFEGSTADGFETTLAVTDPTADRTITLPNVSGTIITTGDTGTVTSTMIADGTIVNADVNTSAAIAHSKLATITAGYVLIGNSSNVPTATEVTGDVTISDAGVTAISSGVIVDADVAANAEIAVSKLANGTANQVIVTDGTDVSWSNDLTLAGKLIAPLGTAVAPSLTFTSDDNTGIYSPGADQLAASVNGSESVRLDSAGKLLIGYSTSIPLGTLEANIQCSGNNTSKSSLSLYTFSATATGEPRISFAKSASSTIGTNALVVEGESLGSIRFYGSQSAAYVTAARIQCFVDGEPETAGDTSDMPGRLVFYTTPEGSGSPEERLTLTSDAVLCYRQPDPTVHSAAATLTIAELKSGIIQYTGAAATLTLPTGALTESGFSGAHTDMTFQWSVINTGSGTCTIAAGTDHTIVGRTTVTANTAGRFASRRTATDTFITYRLS